jgi:hypothetical protein
LQPLYFGNYKLFNFFLLKKMDHQMSQTFLCIFIKKKKQKLKLRKAKQKSPWCTHTTSLFCNTEIRTETQHTLTGGVEQKELSASIPERDFSLFPMPFRIGPIREQLL